MKKTVFIILALTLLSACGKKDSSSGKPKVDIDLYQQRNLELTQTEIVSFHRTEQMVTRYNCQGQIDSRKLETTNSLSKKITIKYEGRKKAWSYEVYNRRTKSKNKGFLTTEGKFVVDYAPTVFNLYVKEGLNDIAYVFYRCTEITKNPQGELTCTGKLEVEKEGLIQLEVLYSSEILPTEKFIQPSCQE